MLRSLQKERVKKMLDQQDVPLKILILDETTQAILSPLLRVSDIRECGVTCHFLIGSQRDAIPEAPSVYFICDADRIPEEVERDLYSAYYINSVTSFRRSQLEQLAERASKKRIANKIRSVFDQFLYFVTLQEDLFSLEIARSFVLSKDPETLRTAVMGLLSVCATLNEVPFILCDGSEIGKALEQKIRNTRLLKKSVKRPLFIILNRNFDLFTPLRHVMTYIELVHDVLGVSLNRVSTTASSKQNKLLFNTTQHAATNQSTYDMDVDSEFFKSNAYADFPLVAEVVERELSEYKKEMALRSLTDRSSPEEIQRALETAPHLQKKNEIISSNLNICMEVLTAIKERSIDEFYFAEENFDREKALELGSKGEHEDVLRLGLYLLHSRLAEVGEQILEARQVKRHLVEFFKANVKQGGLRERLSSFIFRKNSPIVSSVEEALASVRNQSYKSFSVHDPSGSEFFASEISRIVVYVHGGVTYGEMRALKALEDVVKLPIILGGSEILRASDFLGQVDEYLVKKEIS